MYSTGQMTAEKASQNKQERSGGKRAAPIVVRTPVGRTQTLRASAMIPA